MIKSQHPKTYTFTTSYTRYSEKYDAYYNGKTGKWLEKNCGDPECEFCRFRPGTAPRTLKE